MTNFILPLLIIVAAVGGFLKFTDPMLKEIDELQVRQAKLNKALEHAKQLRQVKDRLLEVYNAVPPADRGRLDKLLPNNVDNVRLVIDINNIAKPYNMSVRNLKIKTDEGKSESDVLKSRSASKYGSIVMGFSVSGSYNNFQAFMSDLARSLRLTDVVSVNFSSNPEGNYDYNVEIQTYWLK